MSFTAASASAAHVNDAVIKWQESSARTNVSNSHRLNAKKPAHLTPHKTQKSTHLVCLNRVKPTKNKTFFRAIN